MEYIRCPYMIRTTASSKGIENLCFTAQFINFMLLVSDAYEELVEIFFPILGTRVQLLDNELSRDVVRILSKSGSSEVGC